MKRLEKEEWEGRIMSDNQRLPTAKMMHAFCSSTANKLQRYCKRFAELLQREVTDQNSNGIAASRLLKIVYNPRAHFLGTVFVATFYLNLRCTYIRIE